MKKDMDDVTEKLNVSKDKISSSDEQGNRNVEIIDISVESFLTTRSEENTSDRLCLSNLNIFDTVSNIFGSEATAKLIAEDVFCDKQMQDALQFFVENRMTIEASALLQKMKEKGIKPYDENFKL